MLLIAKQGYIKGKVTGGVEGGGGKEERGRGRGRWRERGEGKGSEVREIGEGEG